MKCNTQNKKIAAITESTMIVGVDVGSETHYARAFDWRNFEYSKKPFEFSNDEAGFSAFQNWLEDLKRKYGKTAVIPGMEPTGHYWINLGVYLQEHGMKPVHVNPHHVKKSKELDDNNPSKNDRKEKRRLVSPSTPRSVPLGTTRFVSFGSTEISFHIYQFGRSHVPLGAVLH